MASETLKVIIRECERMQNVFPEEVLNALNLMVKSVTAFSPTNSHNAKLEAAVAMYIDALRELKHSATEMVGVMKTWEEEHFEKEGGES